MHASRHSSHHSHQACMTSNIMCKRSGTAVEDQILNTTSPHENSKPLIGWAHVNPATKLGGLLFSNLCKSTEELVKTINITIRKKTKTTDIESVTLVITVLSGKPPTKKESKFKCSNEARQRQAVGSIKPLPDRTGKQYDASARVVT